MLDAVPCLYAELCQPAGPIMKVLPSSSVGRDEGTFTNSAETFLSTVKKKKKKCSYLRRKFADGGESPCLSKLSPACTAAAAAEEGLDVLHFA